jgi:hypothetical protein
MGVPEDSMTRLTDSRDEIVTDVAICRDKKGIMNPIESQYRNHKIVIRNVSEFTTIGVTGTPEKQPFTKRIIEVDDVDITSRCRVADSDEQKTEAAKRFIDRIYPQGKSAS